MNSPQDRPEYSLLSVRCHAFDHQRAAIDHLSSLVRLGLGGYTVAINAEKVVRSGRDETFRHLVLSALVKVPDGAGAVLGLRVLHGVHSQKIDYPQATLKAADEMGAACRFAIIGSSQQSHDGAVVEIRRRFPNVNIVMNRCGFTPEDALLAELHKTQPQLCLLAMGTPKQENFAQRAARSGLACIFVGAGGALDILSGHAVRAPAWMVDHYLEWLYRLVKQPSRWRRQLVLPVFMWQLLRQSLRRERA